MPAPAIRLTLPGASRKDTRTQRFGTCPANTYSSLRVCVSPSLRLSLPPPSTLRPSDPPSLHPSASLREIGVSERRCSLAGNRTPAPTASSVPRGCWRNRTCESATSRRPAGFSRASTFTASSHVSRVNPRSSSDVFARADMAAAGDGSATTRRDATMLAPSLNCCKVNGHAENRDRRRRDRR
jgi:hypothetical protein